MARDEDFDNIVLKLSLDEAARVWECLDWFRVVRKPDNHDVTISLLQKVENQLGLTPTRPQGEKTS